MKLAKNFGIATFAIAISVAAVDTKPTQAAVVNYNFGVNATSGSNPGQYFGSFSYDDSLLSGVGEESLAINNGLLSLAFDYLGTTYTEVDDFDYPSYPALSFQNGSLLGLSYVVEDQFFIGGDLDNPNTGGTRFYTIASADFLSATQVGTVSYSRVPEPLALGGTAIASAIGLWVNRKKKASAVAQ